MSYSASLIAYAFVKKGIEEGNPVTQMKLQKLVFFAHGLHLASYNAPLISDTFQAWKYGPVVPRIYHDYKFYGSSPIQDTELFFVFGDPEAANSLLNDMDEKSKTTINITWQALKDTSGAQLSNWTHKKGSPWDQHYQEGINDIVIPDEDIQRYFKANFIKN